MYQVPLVHPPTKTTTQVKCSRKSTRSIQKQVNNHVGPSFGCSYLSHWNICDPWMHILLLGSKTPLCLSFFFKSLDVHFQAIWSCKFVTPIVITIMTANSRTMYSSHVIPQHLITVVHFWQTPQVTLLSTYPGLDVQVAT